MPDDLARRSHALLREAAALDAGERDAFIERACAGDGPLRDRMRRLVGAIERTRGFLEVPALAQREAPDIAPANIEHIPGYRVLGPLGSGGMATVYEGVQEATRRPVAIKVLRHGLADAEALQRFRFETEVLARLRHPGIAQIYDAGVITHAGARVPFFAMELVPSARTVTDYARERGLSVRERLALFADVCDAVQHGHLSGVIHRDLKPSNVLVDPAGRARVIDFGVARSTDPDQTLITRQSDLRALVGTLHYMSPEQCAGEAVDARADVYSLGVILYELVTGRRPHDLTKTPIPEALRIIREERPKRPSAFDPGLRGDIDAIVLTAIDKDPERRYRTAAALATDIRHHLRHETIEARPLTLMYQCRQFALRNRALVAAAAIVGVALVADLAVTTVFAIRASREATMRRAAEAVAIEDRDRALWQSYIANVAAALSGFQSGEFALMRRRLAEAPAQHRGWEWRMLASLADRSLSTTPAHDDMIFAFDSSADGSLLATAGRDGAFRVWRSSEPVAIVCEGGEGDAPIFSIAFSEPPDRLVTGDGAGRVRLWDATDGRLIRELSRFDRAVDSVAFGAGGVVAAASRGEAARLLDADSGATLGAIDDHADGVTGVAFDAAGQQLAAWDQSGRITLRDGAGRPARATMAFPGEPYTAAFSADGALLAVGGVEGRTLVWDAATGEERFALRIPSTVTGVRAVAFSPDARFLAASGIDRGVVFWRMADGAQGALRRGHTDAVSGLAFSHDGQRLFSASWDRTLRTWEVGSSEPVDLIERLAGHTDRVINIEFSPDGALLASASVDGSVRLWDTSLGEPLGALYQHDEAVYALAFSPAGDRIASGAHDDRVRIWSVRTGEQIATLEGHTGDVWSVAFTPDGERIVSGAGDRTIRIWDAATGAPLRTLTGHGERVNCVAVSPDGEVIASGSRDHSVRLWNARTGEPLRTLAGHSSDVFAVVFSADGRTLYSGSRDQSVRVWRISDGELIESLEGHGQFVTSLALTPDQSRLAAGSWFGEIVIWDSRVGDIVASFRGHDDAVRDVAFDPLGRRLATGSHDGTIRIFDDQPEAVRVLHRREAERLRTGARETVARLIAERGDVEAAALELESGAYDAEALPSLRRAMLRAALATRDQSPGRPNPTER